MSSRLGACSANQTSTFCYEYSTKTQLKLPLAAGTQASLQDAMGCTSESRDRRAWTTTRAALYA